MFNLFFKDKKALKLVPLLNLRQICHIFGVESTRIRLLAAAIEQRYRLDGKPISSPNFGYFFSSYKSVIEVASG